MSSEQGGSGNNSSASSETTTQLVKVEDGSIPAGSLSESSVAKVVLSEKELRTLSAEALIEHCQQQQLHAKGLEQQLKLNEGDLVEVRENLERTKTQLGELQQKEKMLVRRLAAKEQEMQDYVCQVNELKQSQATTTTSLRATLLDPAVNTLLQMLRAELQSTKAKLEETQNDLSAWKFTPDSNTGKRLMAKCRQLHQENEELGKITSSGRIAILEGDLALQKKFSEEVRQSQLELDSFLADLDEDVEGMQSTILLLQQELRKSKEQCGDLLKENGQLKSTMQQSTTMVNGTSTNALAASTAAAAAMTTATAITAATTSPHSMMECDEDTLTVVDNDSGSCHNNKRANGDSNSSTSSSSVCCADEDKADSEMRTTSSRTLHHQHNNHHHQQHHHLHHNNNKRVRRSSVLSIDYNDDEDALIINNTNGDANAISD